MANKRIKDLSTTAAVTASDDFIAVDGATNGTRKLDAYSPTFGGNVTVTGALLAHQTGTLNMAYEGSSLSQLVAYGADASTYGRANIILRKAGTGVGAVTALALTSTDATFGGNLTVSGGTISSGTASLTLKSTASTVLLQSAGTTALTLDSSQNATFAGDIRFSLANTFDIGQTGTRVRAAYIRTLVLTSNAPAAANSTGTAGTVTWDTNYLYVCTATDTWKRVAIATWP